MSKISTLFCLISLIFVPFIISTSPSVTQISSYSLLSTTPDAEIDGFFFLEGNTVVYNSTGQVTYSISKVKNCTTLPLITTSQQVWCLSLRENSSTLNLLDTQAKKVEKSFPLPENFSCASLIFSVSGNIIVLNCSTTGSTSFKIALFDTNQTQYVCTNLSQEFSGVYYAGAYASNAFFYVQPGKNNDTEYYYIPCNGGSETVTKGPNDFVESSYLPFNQSTVFLNFYSTEKNKEVNTVIQGSSFDVFGNVFLGNAMNVTNVARVNDTHFITTENENSILKLRLCTLTPRMEIYTLSSYLTGINSSITTFTASGIQGTTRVYVNFFSSYYIFDFEVNGIVNAMGYIPPLIMSNSSTIYITQAGYLIQNSGASLLQFVNVPNYGVYYSPSNPLHIWAYYIPTATMIYSQCLIVDIDGGNSTIQTTYFDNCPNGILTTTVTVKDIVYDANRNIIFSYRDHLNSLYIISQNSYSGPYLTLTTILSPTISLNISNGTGSFIGRGIQNLVAGTFSTSTGTILSKYSLPMSGFTTKLDQRYFLIGSLSGATTTFSVWDTVEAQIVNNVSLNLAYYQSSLTPFMSLGINSNNPTIYTGLVVQTNYNEVMVLNAEGGAYKLYDSSNFYYDGIIAIGPTTFSLPISYDYITTYYMYNVTSWGDDLARIEI